MYLWVIAVRLLCCAISNNSNHHIHCCQVLDNDIHNLFVILHNQMECHWNCLIECAGVIDFGKGAVYKVKNSLL